MPTLVVVTREGKEITIDGAAGVSLMENIRSADIDDLAALCGGCCACATCHVYIDEGWSEKLSGIASSEDDLLDCSDHRKDNSRLSCQIQLTDEMDGIRLVIAPED